MALISIRAREITSRFLPSLAIGLPKASTGPCALDHQFQRNLGFADGAHAVVDPARPEAHLRNLEAAAFAEQHILLRHTDIVEAQMHVAMRGMIFAEHLHRAEDFHAGRVGIGTRICDCCFDGAAFGSLVLTITIMILQRGSPAPEM
jgi:hypothetical protein